MIALALQDTEKGRRIAPGKAAKTLTARGMMTTV
jgi:hypothetical protein